MTSQIAHNPLPLDAVALESPSRIYVSEPQWRWTTTIPDYYNLWYVLRGKGTMRVNGVQQALTSGVAFLLAPGTAVDASHDADDPIHNYAAHFWPLRRGRQLARAHGLPVAGVAVHDSGLFEVIARQTVRLGEGERPFGTPLAAALVFALVIQIMRSVSLPAADPVDQRLWEIMDRISANPGQPYTVEALAREAGLSRVHFTRRFRRATGETPSRYIIRRRIERAGQLIRESGLKLAVIADLLGYSDVYFFSRQFKQFTGYSPAQWRREPSPPERVERLSLSS